MPWQDQRLGGPTDHVEVDFQGHEHTTSIAALDHNGRCHSLVRTRKYKTDVIDKQVALMQKRGIWKKPSYKKS